MDAYIADFPEQIQEILQEIRATIEQATPEAEETISYKMPTFNLNGHYLVYFAGYKKYISLYPVPVGDPEFDEEISAYQVGKGTVQFPLDRPIPYQLITKIVKIRMRENKERARAKAKK